MIELYSQLPKNNLEDKFLRKTLEVIWNTTIGGLFNKRSLMMVAMSKCDL